MGLMFNTVTTQHLVVRKTLLGWNTKYLSSYPAWNAKYLHLGIQNTYSLESKILTAWKQKFFTSPFGRIYSGKKQFREEVKEIESGHFSKLKSQQTVWIADQIGRLKRNQAFGGNLYLPRIWKLGKMRFQSFSPQKSRCFPHIKYFRLRQENLLGEVTKIRAQEESF